MNPVIRQQKMPLLAAARFEGETVIKLASANYMVQDLCFFPAKT
jgi:UDP-N-acetylglucosamine 1-carboxyvinyltransferase